MIRILVCTLIACGTSASAAPLPNIVYIISDDQAYVDYGFMGSENVLTPNLDRLAASSARHPNAYVPSSLCRPSLATLMNGLYPYQHGIHFNHPPPGFKEMSQSQTPALYKRARQTAVDLLKKTPTLPQILADLRCECHAAAVQRHVHGFETRRRRRAGKPAVDHLRQ